MESFSRVERRKSNNSNPKATKQSSHTSDFQDAIDLQQAFCMLCVFRVLFEFRLFTPSFPSLFTAFFFVLPTRYGAGFGFVFFCNPQIPQTAILFMSTRSVLDLLFFAFCFSNIFSIWLLLSFLVSRLISAQIAFLSFSSLLKRIFA